MRTLVGMTIINNLQIRTWKWSRPTKLVRLATCADSWRVHENISYLPFAMWRSKSIVDDVFDRAGNVHCVLRLVNVTIIAIKQNEILLTYQKKQLAQINNITLGHWMIGIDLGKQPGQVIYHIRHFAL